MARSPQTEPPQGDRRPVRARSAAPFQWAGARLARAGVAPNVISVSSFVFASLAGALLMWTAWLAPGSLGARAAWVGAGALVAIRLVANVLDGLVAIEYHRRSPLGGLLNELPDRFSDAVILIGLGYAAGGRVELGYGAATVAVIVAYLRELGRRLGSRNHFVGPMAKPHRMYLVIACCTLMALLPAGWIARATWRGHGPASAALAFIITLGLVTIVRRFVLIAGDLAHAPAETDA